MLRVAQFVVETARPMPKSLSHRSRRKYPLATGVTHLTIAHEKLRRAANRVLKGRYLPEEGEFVEGSIAWLSIQLWFVVEKVPRTEIVADLAFREAELACYAGCCAIDAAYVCMVFGGMGLHRDRAISYALETWRHRQVAESLANGEGIPDQGSLRQREAYQNGGLAAK